MMTVDHIRETWYDYHTIIREDIMWVLWAIVSIVSLAILCVGVNNLINEKVDNAIKGLNK